MNSVLDKAKPNFCKVPRLQDQFKDIKDYISPLYPSHKKHSSGLEVIPSKHGIELPLKSFVQDNEFVIQEKFFRRVVELYGSWKFLKAGAMEKVCFKPKEIKACIVTCGGLCPGLNSVIKSIVSCLTSEYGAEEIWGIKWGYRGFFENDGKYWIKLGMKEVDNI